MIQIITQIFIPTIGFEPTSWVKKGNFQLLIFKPIKLSIVL